MTLRTLSPGGLPGGSVMSRKSKITRLLVVSCTCIILLYTFFYVFVITERLDATEVASYEQNDLPSTFLMHNTVIKQLPQSSSTLVSLAKKKRNAYRIRDKNDARFGQLVEHGSSSSSNQVKDVNGVSAIESVENASSWVSTSFTIVVMAVKNRWNSYYYRRSLEEKQNYAIKHGYGLIVQTVDLDPTRDHAWSKVQLVQNHLYDEKATRHWVWLLDLDTIIMNPNVTLESIADPSYDIIISEDCNGLNSGSVLFQNTIWVDQFLDLVYRTNDADFVPGVKELWEQAAIAYLYSRFKEQYDRDYRFKIVHQKTFNSYPEETTKEPRCKQGRFEQGDFVVHFAGASNKNEIYDRYYSALTEGYT